MKNIEQLLNKENWIKYLEIASEGGITNNGKAQDIVKEIEEAINNSRFFETLIENKFDKGYNKGYNDAMKGNNYEY